MDKYVYSTTFQFLVTETHYVLYVETEKLIFQRDMDKSDMDKSNDVIDLDEEDEEEEKKPAAAAQKQEGKEQKPKEPVASSSKAPPPPPQPKAEVTRAKVVQISDV